VAVMPKHLDVTLPLWSGEPERALLWQCDGPISLAQFAQQVAALLTQLPSGSAMINMCE
jgi:hypothetical protein